MRAVLLACLALNIAAGQARADDGCGRFDWPVDRERMLFSDGFVVDVESESALPKDGVFSLLLQPVATVIYTVLPERGRDDGLGGVVTLEWISAGRYQVTLSGEAWIDALQNERRLPMLASTSRNDCPGIRQSSSLRARGHSCQAPALRRSACRRYPANISSPPSPCRTTFTAPSSFWHSSQSGMFAASAKGSS